MQLYALEICLMTCDVIDDKWLNDNNIERNFKAELRIYSLSSYQCFFSLFSLSFEYLNFHTMESSKQSVFLIKTVNGV